jgi:uncharacterized membrane protein
MSPCGRGDFITRCGDVLDRTAGRENSVMGQGTKGNVTSVAQRNCVPSPDGVTAAPRADMRVRSAHEIAALLAIGAVERPIEIGILKYLLQFRAHDGLYSVEPRGRVNAAPGSDHNRVGTRDMATTDPTSPVFYVYALFDWLGRVFYIGKGKGYRAWHHKYMPKSNRNRYRRNILLKTIRILGDCPVVIIRDGLIEAEAFAMETAFIKAIGRFPNGPLVNMTDGGEGSAGPRHISDELRARMAETTRLRSTGKSPSAETRQKLRDALKGRTRPREIAEKIVATRKANAKLLSEESLARIKAAAQNRPQSWRDNLSKVNVGKTLSAEHRANIAAGLARHRAKLALEQSQEAQDEQPHRGTEQLSLWPLLSEPPSDS